MAWRNRYRIEDKGRVRRYMPGPLYYIGMAYCLFVVGVNLWSAYHHRSAPASSRNASAVHMRAPRVAR